jgi:ligand-binding sensor domain-containing protein
LPSLDITSLVRAFGVLWLGTYNHGLARWEEGNLTEVTTERWNMDRRINDLAVTGGGTDRERLWVATDRGLYWHDGRRFVRVVDNQGPGRQHTTSLFVDTDGETLWVTSSRQVCRHHRGRWQAWGGDQSLPLVNLHSVTRSGAGHLWLGSLHGLYRFDPEGGEFTRHSVATGALPVDWVTALLPWGRGLVAGTYHGGLSWFDGQRFTLEREGPGGPMPSGWVNPHSLRWHNDWLWVGTLDRGLVVGRAGQWYHLRRTDGLPSDDVTAILPDGPDGAWVSTRGGLARVSWATTTQHHGRHTEAGRQSLDRP